MSYSRFAIYYVPPVGRLADFGAAWLGWDIAAGSDVCQPDLPGLKNITAKPRKYGFHGTLKAPFRLAEGCTFNTLEAEVSQLAQGLPLAKCEALELSTQSGFLALTPQGDATGLRSLAEACVRGIDGFRAPASGAELARRRKAGLSPAQEELLARWGYPYVMGKFSFHMTLSERLQQNVAKQWADRSRDLLPPLPRPFVIDQIALCGERGDGNFELIRRYALAG